MDFFALPNAESARGAYYSILGAGNNSNLEGIRTVARKWLEQGAPVACTPNGIEGLPPTFQVP